MKNLIIALMCFWTVTSVQAQKLNIKEGGIFAVETHHTYLLDVGRGPVKKTQDFIFQFKLISNTNEGYKLSCTMYNAKLWDNFSSSGEVNKFNSDSIRLSNTHNSGIVMPLVFLQKTFNVILAPNGKFVRAEGVDELIKQAVAKWHLRESVQEYTTNNWPEFIIPTIKNIFFEKPVQKIAYQSAWTNTETNTTYKVTAIAGSLLTITASSADTLKAKYTLNDVNGLVEDATTTIAKNVDEKVKEQHDYSHKIIYDKQFTIADTAWANMAVMLSYWNQTLRPDDYHVDSATVFNYFKTYDLIYKDDPHYITEKVALVNEVGKGAWDIYKKLVLTTPNKFLRETELQNKMNYVMDTDIDQIYDFVKYRFKTLAFQSWISGFDVRLLSRPSDEGTLQRLMGQGYSRAKATEIAMSQDKNLANANLLLERMHNDPDPAFRQKVEAMYLWINAFYKNKNVPFLQKTAKQFIKLNDNYMKAGNGGRYGIALYGLLSKTDAVEDADAVLNKTISDVERYLVDTAYNSDTYVAKRAKTSLKEILMVGYYIKYQQTKLTDSAKALTYLAKAAQYSPLNFDEKSNVISADRAVFLSCSIRSNTSYRKEYIQKLFAAGGTEEAMKLFASNITEDLGSLGEMQKIYKKQFPDKEFGDFVKTNIIANWEKAPAFTGKDIKGKTYKLSDYKGKWLLLDFWGTWCPPCRAEMPEVEKFNKELSAGKHAGIVMLGIADDEEKALNRYLQDNKPTLTSVLAEGIPHKYGINAFPTKCIIAPNGKMIKLTYGADWVDVVTKLNELYAAN